MSSIYVVGTVFGTVGSVWSAFVSARVPVPASVGLTPPPPLLLVTSVEVNEIVLGTFRSFSSSFRVQQLGVVIPDTTDIELEFLPIKCGSMCFLNKRTSFWRDSFFRSSSEYPAISMARAVVIKCFTEH